MGILLVAMLATGLIIGVPALGILVIASRYARSRPLKYLAVSGTLVVSLLVFLVLVMPVARWILSATVRKGDAVPVSEFCGTGPRLPSDAGPVTYYSNYMGCEATCSISEAAFVDWAKKKGWEVAEIGREERVRLPRLEIERGVTNGLVVDPSSHRGGVKLVYDRSNGTCYYDFASH